MGCDVFLLRKEYVSYDKETNTDLIKQQMFWSASSSNLGIAFVENLNADTGWKSVCPDEFAEFCKQMLANGDCGKYPNGALKEVIKDLAELDDDTKWGSDWYISVDY